MITTTDLHHEKDTEAAGVAVAPTCDAIIRPAVAAEAPVLHHLISTYLDAGHLLPRTLEEVTRHADRFVVAVDDDGVIGGAELAPLSHTVAEIRSLVVDERRRRRGTGTRLTRALIEQATRQRFSTLCAFVHDPSPFVRLGFSLVPHVWMTEKILTDCRTCSRLRHCRQHALRLDLAAHVRRPASGRSALGGA